MANKNTSKFENSNSKESVNKLIFNNSKFSDFVITHNNSGKEITAHKVILYLSDSEYMRSFFGNSSFSESASGSLNVDCEYYDTFTILLNSIYQINDIFMQYINMLIEGIVEFTQKNKVNLYLDWNTLDKYPEYSDNIAKLQDLYKTMKYYQLNEHLEYINNLILKNITVDRLLIDLGQINPDIAKIMFDYSDEEMIKRFNDLSLLNMFLVEEEVDVQLEEEPEELAKVRDDELLNKLKYLALI
jgi:hypothetical protein